MNTTLVANDICERTIVYWQETNQLLPEIIKFDPEAILEIMDGIPNQHQELLFALEEQAEQR